MSDNSGVTLSGLTPTSNVYNSNNQLTTATYVAGNQTQIGGYTMQYDAENRMISNTVDNGTTSYAYDGSGKRVVKQTPVTTTQYVYDPFGQLVAEYTQGTVPPAPPCTTCYLLADHLGSTRMLTDGTTGAVKELHDYLPFGEELLSGTDGRDGTWGGPDPAQKFTGQYRDGESGLDYFRARHYAPALGTFMQPDPAGSIVADPGDPQSWHLYNYVTNRPLVNTDPSGLGPLGPAFGPGDDCDNDPSCGDWGWSWGWAWAWEQPSRPPIQLPPPKPTRIPATTDPYSVDSGGAGASCDPPFCFSEIDPNSIEQHHVFVQAFRAWFQAAGIDIDKFLIALPAGVHRLAAFNGIHTGADNWNAQWIRFRTQFPKASPEEIFDFAKQLVKKFKIGGFPGGSTFESFPIIFIDTCKLDPYQPVCLGRGSSGPIY